MTTREVTTFFFRNARRPGRDRRKVSLTVRVGAIYQAVILPCDAIRLLSTALPPYSERVVLSELSLALLMKRCMRATERSEETTLGTRRLSSQAENLSHTHTSLSSSALSAFSDLLQARGVEGGCGVVGVRG